MVLVQCLANAEVAVLEVGVLRVVGLEAEGGEGRVACHGEGKDPHPQSESTVGM